MPLTRFMMFCLAVALTVGVAQAKPPFEYSCVDDEVHITWCCPEDGKEAVDGARLVGALVCMESGFKYYEVLEEDNLVERTPVTSNQVQFTKMMVTSTLKIRLYPYEEMLAYRCADRVKSAKEDKKLSKMSARILKDLKQKKAAGRCTRTSADASQ